MSRRYPKLFIRSKNEFAKHISHKKFSQGQALALINDVLLHKDNYWKDSKRSEPQKDKYVRNAKGTPLGVLLSKINTMVLAPHDNLLPRFIFGGVKKSNHVMAAAHLLGETRKRTILKLDVTKFFEQITRQRAYEFFIYKCLCDEKTSKILSTLCSVPRGPKNASTGGESIGRGFATSSRLAVWCNLDVFIKLERLVQKRLKGHDPRLAIYVDDIAVTASKISKEDMQTLSVEIAELLLTGDLKQPLPLNASKTKIALHSEGLEHLGLRLHRNKLAINTKTREKIRKINDTLRDETSQLERKNLKLKKSALGHYQRFVERKGVSS